jgi:hypothetical protein
VDDERRGLALLHEGEQLAARIEGERAVLPVVERVVAIVEPERAQVRATARRDVQQPDHARLPHHHEAPAAIPAEQIVDALGAARAHGELEVRGLALATEGEPGATGPGALDREGPRLRELCELERYGWYRGRQG